MATKTAIVTGASRGIGRATALRLARAGYAIVAVARGRDGLAAAARQIEQAGGTCEIVAADVGCPEDARRVVEATCARFGGVDLLVNNAGVALLRSIDQMSDEEFARTLGANVEAVFRLCRAVWPTMRAAGGGVIVNVSSLSSVDPFPGFAVYGACKAWVNLFTQALAAEGRPLGIRVLAVAPGAVETDMLRGLFPDLPAENVLQPDEVAAVIERLASESMAPCSGQTIFCRK